MGNSGDVQVTGELDLWRNLANKHGLRKPKALAYLKDVLSSLEWLVCAARPARAAAP